MSAHQLESRRGREGEKAGLCFQKKQPFFILISQEVTVMAVEGAGLGMLEGDVLFSQNKLNADNGKAGFFPGTSTSI